MFELEDYNSGAIHDGFLNKYAESPVATLDFYISDSLQDMLDVDIRTEIANVVGSSTDYTNCLHELSLSDQATDGLSSLNYNTNGSSNNCNSLEIPSSQIGFTSSNSSSLWFGSSSDIYADVGACVNPLSVMPLVSSSLFPMTPKVTLNSKVMASDPPSPTSPIASDTKSHLTFSPAYMKLAAKSMHNEQLTSHISRKNVSMISSSAGVSTTLAPPVAVISNGVGPQRNASSAADTVKRDILATMPKTVTSVSSSPTIDTDICILDSNHKPFRQATIVGNNCLSKPPSPNEYGINGDGSNVKLNVVNIGNVGNLTFANSIAYNKVKQQSSVKSPQGSPITANGNTGTIILKRERDSSPLQNIPALSNTNGHHGSTKVLSRSGQVSTFTPKSIASQTYILNQSQHQNQIQNSNTIISLPSITNNIGQHSSYTNNPNGTITGGLIPISTNTIISGTNLTISKGGLQQKTKIPHMESEYPKPGYSYSCLIAMALKNSRRGSLPVSEIYNFMCEHFPYFKTAPAGWKNSVRHNLSLNKCFEKIEKPPTNGNQRKGCLWAMNPERIAKMDEEVQKWSRKDPQAILNAMVCPDNLSALERGEMKHGSSADYDIDLDSQSEIEESSDFEEEIDESLVESMLVEEDIDDDESAMNSTSILNNNVVLINSNDVIQEGITNNSRGMQNGLSLSFVSKADGKTSSKLNDLNGGSHLQMTSADTKQDYVIEEMYDSIEEEKDGIESRISHSDIIELSPADYNTAIEEEDCPLPKRPCLNVNYSMIPIDQGERHSKQQHQQAKQQQQQQQQLQQQQQKQQQIQIQNIKKIVKVQSVHDLQKLQQQLQKHHLQQQYQKQKQQQQHLQESQSQNMQHQQQQQQLQKAKQKLQQHVVLQAIPTNNANGSTFPLLGQEQIAGIGTLSGFSSICANGRKLQVLNKIG